MTEAEKLMQLIAKYMDLYELIAIKIKTDIASMLLNERHRRGLTQRQFADLLDCSQSEVSKWERGDSNMTINTLARICAKLGIVPYTILRKERYETLD